MLPDELRVTIEKLLALPMYLPLALERVVICSFVSSTPVPRGLPFSFQ
jgi:hypothetical protein